MKQTYTFDVVQTVEVELDEEDVTQEYLDEFSNYMWQVDSIKDIAEHIARQKALFDGYTPEFVPENYKATIIGESVEEV